MVGGWGSCIRLDYNNKFSIIQIDEFQIGFKCVTMLPLTDVYRLGFYLSFELMDIKLYKRRN